MCNTNSSIRGYSVVIYNNKIIYIKNYIKGGIYTCIANRNIYMGNNRSKLCSELPFRSPACLLYSINKLIRRSVGQLPIYRATVCPSVH